MSAPIRFALRLLPHGIPVVVMLLLYCSAYIRYFPAPHVTRNIAVNEKFAAFATHGMHDAPPDVLAFGSSMALNNLASEEVIEHLGAERYFNLGAWGLDMAQTCGIAAAFAEKYRPRTIIIAGNLRDFAASVERSDVRVRPVMRLARTGPTPWMYLTHPDMVYYLRQMENNKLRFLDPGNYECLRMDAHGGVALYVARERIIADRWDRPVPSSADLVEEKYAALGRLATSLRTLGIDLVFVAPPYRDGIRTPEASETIARHITKVRNLLTERGQFFCDGYDRTWPDGLFSDSSHLNGAGARIFTAHVLARLGRSAIRPKGMKGS